MPQLHKPKSCSGVNSCYPLLVLGLNIYDEIGEVNEDNGFFDYSVSLLTYPVVYVGWSKCTFKAFVQQHYHALIMAANLNDRSCNIFRSHP